MVVSTRRIISNFPAAYLSNKLNIGTEIKVFIKH